MNTSAVLSRFPFMLARRLFVLACIISAGVALSISSLNTQARQLSQSYTVDYALGDNDSHASAREIALHKIRMLAIQKAGKYVQGVEQLNQEQLSQNIRIVSASVVAISHVKETYSIGSHNQSVLHLEAVAEIDDAQLKERIIAIQSDAAQRSRLVKYESDLEAIIKRFKTLAAKKTDNQQAIDAIIAERNALILNLHATLKAASLEFEQGFIIQKAAKVNTYINTNINLIESELYQHIMDKTEVKLSTKDAFLNEATGLYDYRVSVSWDVPSLPQEMYKKIHSEKNFLRMAKKVTDSASNYHCSYCENLGGDDVAVDYNGLSLASVLGYDGSPQVVLLNPHNSLDSQKLIERLSLSKINVDIFLKDIHHQHISLPVTSELITDRDTAHRYIVFSSGREIITFHLTEKEAKRAMGIGAKLTLSK